VRLGLYLRISSDPEGRSASIDRQENDARRLADARGDEVVQTYTDRDLSAYTGVDRPAFEELLADAEAGLIDGILVWKLDRLTRRFSDLERIWRLIERRKVALLSVNDSIDTTIAAGKFMLRTMVGIAEIESANTSLRVRRAKADDARNGQPNPGGMRAMGYTPSKRELVPEEAEAIRDAAERLLAGESLRSIVNDLNARGILTPHGKTWLPGTLASVLVSPRIAGLRSYKGQIVAAAAWPAIISREQHERLVVLRKDPTRRWVPRGRPPQHLLAGLVECERCGENATRMVNRPERGRDYYQCRKPPLGRGCGQLVSGRQLDALVVERIFGALDSPEFTQALRTPSPAQMGLASQLERDEDKLAWLGQEYADDHLPEPAFLAATRKVEERIKQTRAQIARQHRTAAVAALPANADQLRAAWDSWDLERRRGLVDALIEKVVVRPSALGSKTGRRFDRSRAQIVWRSDRLPTYAMPSG
jgi:DNA invertase Pin-like site-specific DNA recombinase